MEDELNPAVLGELLGLLAHDLRNPLSALHSNVGFLGSAIVDIDEETREALSDTLVSCDGLAHIIDNMELLALALSGRSELTKLRFDLAPLLAEVVLKNQALAKSHGVRLATASELTRQSIPIQAHRDMLSRAIGNLLRNSIQHSSGDPSVTVALRSEGSRAIVTIRDGGMPLAEELHEEGFTARGQLLAKTARGGRYSRGLGLFSARVAAQAAGAEISVARVESGNVFELAVPLST